MGFYKLFARSPFDPLNELLGKVDGCVKEMRPMLQAAFAGKYNEVKDHFDIITGVEHEADVIKQSIRDKLPSSMFLPIDRLHFLEILSSTDKIADRAEDLGYLLTIRDTKFAEALQVELTSHLDKSLECYEKLKSSMSRLDALIDAGFAGPVAEEVIRGIDEVGYLEWETDKIGYKFAKFLFAHEKEIDVVDLMMIRDISKLISKFADSCEHLAKVVRRTLAR